MMGWFEAGAITEQARSALSGFQLGRGTGRFLLCDAGGCRGIRGWEGPPGDRGCSAMWRGSRAGCGWDVGRGCLCRGPGGELAAAGARAVPAGGQVPARLRISGGSRGGQRPAGTRTAASAAASASLGSYRRRPRPRSATFGERSEEVGEKANGVGKNRRGSWPLGNLLPCTPVATPSVSVSVSVWLCVLVCVVRVPWGQIRAFSPASHQPEWLSGWPGYFCINSAAAVSSRALRGSQGTKPLSMPEATLFPRRWGGSLWGSSPPVHGGLRSFSHWHFCTLLL